MENERYKMIRILTQTQYDAICDLYMDQQKKIKEQEKEIKRLKARAERLSYLLDKELAADQQIDFPNSYRGYKHEEFLF